MPTNADLLLDTSAALAVVRDTNDVHDRAIDVTRGKSIGLAGHAMLETFSVLTRLPGQARVSAAVAAKIIAQNFPESVALATDIALRAPSIFAGAGVAGGSVYDGLVGLAAKSAGITLLPCEHQGADADLRAGQTNGFARGVQSELP